MGGYEMRKLIVTLGAPGSGKSYWIKQNDLGPYTIEVDNIRMLYASPETVAINGQDGLDQSISQSYNKEVFNTAYEMLENRMKHGMTTVFDSTMLYKKAWSPINKLVKKYHYKVIVIDFMADLIKRCKHKYGEDWYDQVIVQLSNYNNKRSFYKRVEISTIKKFVDRYLDNGGNIPSSAEVYPPLSVGSNDNDIFGIIYNGLDQDISPLDFDKRFKKIQIIGDVHGDMSALEKVFDNHESGTAYVFVGDYLDRGSASDKVFDFITSELSGSNLFFLRGNHELSWEIWRNQRRKTGQFGHQTLDVLLSKYGEKELDRRIDKMEDKFLDYLYFIWDRKRFYITHAGLEPSANFLGLANEEEFVMGVPDNETHNPYDRDVDKIWSTYKDSLSFNIHGHRNQFNHFVLNNSINLTAEDKFRWVTLTKDKIIPHEIDRIDTKSLIEKLSDDYDIKQSSLDHGIVANNFNSKIFIKNKFNNERIKARGLFSRDNQIIGRGFDKFFAIDERGSQDSLDTIKYPVEVARKWNGFPVYTFYDKKFKQVKCYSKAGDYTYSLFGEQVLKDVSFPNTRHQTYWEFLKNEYFSDLANQNTTVVFEIIDPINNPHIELYTEKTAIPLAVITNNTQGKVVDSLLQADNPARAKLMQVINDETKIGVAKNKVELEEMIKDYNEKYPLREGLVLYGQNKLLKWKSPFYLKAKELRQALDQYNKGKEKASWHYGAEPWYKFCIENNETEFTPKLAKQLYQVDGPIIKFN